MKSRGRKKGENKGLKNEEGEEGGRGMKRRWIFFFPPPFQALLESEQKKNDDIVQQVRKNNIRNCLNMCFNAYLFFSNLNLKCFAHDLTYH